MSEDENIFNKEMEILNHAKKIISNNDIDLEELRSEYIQLVKQYKKLTKLSHKLVTMADKSHKKLRENQKKLEQLSITDTLTSLINRRGISILIDEEVIRYRRRKTSFMIFILDIDHFKKINDNYGHNIGDKVLVTLSEIMLSSVREQDSIARWGGEEFLLLLPDTDITGGQIIAEKLRKKVKNYKFSFNEIELSITISLGGAVFSGHRQVEQTIEKADNALYRSKVEGRNRVNINEY